MPLQVVALGRLEPVSDVINLTPVLPLETNTVAELRVDAGDSVQQGEVVAVLGSYERLAQAQAQAEEQVNIA